MGHRGHLKDEYRTLLDRLDAGQVGMPEPEDPVAWDGWRDILEIMFTPEEAEFASQLPVRPSGLGTIAARMGIAPEALKPRLDALCDKGLVMDLVQPKTGKTRYLLAPPVVGFFEFSFMRAKDMYPKKPLAEAMRQYMYGDPAFAKATFGHATVVGRALVHEDEVAQEVPEVLDYERATAVIEDAWMHAVTICYCRHKAEHLGKDCDAPKEICLALNIGAEFLIRRGFAREITKQESLGLLALARKHGLVQIADNAKDQPVYICNCCGCCCGQLAAINLFDLRAVNPSGFVPRVDREACRGCSRCSRACPVTAIEMKAERAAGQRKNELVPQVNLDRCIGCGVCASSCKKQALSMVRAAERPIIPGNAVDRTVRMMIERGRLADMLFDEGSSRGSAFLNRVIKTLTKLPPAQQLLAQEQVKSRFVKVALGFVRGVSGRP